MIKRPFVWVLAAYMAGMYLAWLRLPQILPLGISIVTLALLYFIMYRFKNKYISRQDHFLWCLPLLLILGFYAMVSQLSRPALDQAFDQETEGRLTGKITMVVEKKQGRVLYVTDNTVYLSDRKPYLCENIIVYCSDAQSYHVGNSVEVFGKLQKFSEAANPGQFNEKMYYQIENIDYKFMAKSVQITDKRYSKYRDILDRMKQKLKRVYEVLLPPKESGALIAMLLGENQLLEDEIKQLYQQNGISHILAISGLHVSLIGLFIYNLFKKMKLGILPATILSIIFIYSYGVLTNFSVSTNRAVVMMIVMMLSGILGKTYDMLSSMALSAFLILLQNPLQILQAGFLLSFGAVLGIALLTPALQRIFPSKNKFLSGLFISISAQLMTLPFILIFFYQLPVYSLFINLLILPFSSIQILTALAAGIAGAIYMPLGVFIIGASNYILKFTEAICRIGSSLPGNLFTTGKPEPIRIILYSLLIILFLWSVKRFQKRISILLLAVACFILIFPKHISGLEVTMLDVGQGEAIFLRSETGVTYLIDGGSSDVSKVGTYRLQPFLLYNGVDCIDYAIISHADSDHISGVMELMQGSKIQIRTLILPELPEKSEGYVKLEELAKGNGVSIHYIQAGDYIKDGKLRMICLHPASHFHGEADNAFSTVLSVSYGDFDMLLTGDLDKAGEEQLDKLFEKINSGSEYREKGGIPNDLLPDIDNESVRNNGDDGENSGNDDGRIAGNDEALQKMMEEGIIPATDYDVLQVAHHGSKYSTYPDFLGLVQPEYSLITCGKDNKRVMKLIQSRFQCSTQERHILALL